MYVDAAAEAGVVICVLQCSTIRYMSLCMPMNGWPCNVRRMGFYDYSTLFVQI